MMIKGSKAVWSGRVERSLNEKTLDEFEAKGETNNRSKRKED